MSDAVRLGPASARAPPQGVSACEPHHVKRHPLHPNHRHRPRPGPIRGKEVPCPTSSSRSIRPNRSPTKRSSATTGGTPTSRRPSTSSPVTRSAWTAANGSTASSRTTTAPTTSATLPSTSSTRSRDRSPSKARSPVTCSSSTSSTSVQSRRRRVRSPVRLGVHGHLREGERWVLPRRPVPRRVQGDLGLQRRDRDLPPRPGGLVHRHRPPRTHGHRAECGPARDVEHP